MEKIVVVDDEDGIRALLRRVLDAPDREVTTYPSATDAMAGMRRSPPDVVVTDLNMPQVSGSDFIGLIRDEFGDQVGIIVITAYPGMVCDSDWVANGVGAYLRKPFTDLDLLRSTVSQVIAGRRGRMEMTPQEERVSCALSSLRDQRAHLSRVVAVFEQIADGIIVTDRHGRVEIINPAAAEVIQRSVHECLMTPLADLVGDPALQKVLVAAEPEAGFRPGLAKLTDGRVFMTKATPLVNHNDEWVGSIRVLLDHTAQQRIQELKSHYLTVVAHELRTPLTVLQNLAAVLQRREAGSRSSVVVAAMADQCTRLEHQVDKLILLARFDDADCTGDAEVLDAREVAQAAVRRFQDRAREQAIELGCDVPAGVVTLLASREDLSRALHELVDNSIKFTPPGGRVEVKVGVVPSGISFRVSDTGIGIDAAHLPEIFREFSQLEPPQTRTYSGAGLGLALARRIVEAWKGSIRVDSRLGGGATFEILLPSPVSGER